MHAVRTLNRSTEGADGESRGEGPLSVAYFSPAWPPGTMSNGIVTYVGTIAEAMRARGHSATVITPRAGLDAPTDEVYGLSEDPGRWTLSDRLLERLEFRMHPDRAWHRKVCRSIVEATRRAIEERGVQLLEIEESFGWPSRIRREIPIPIVVRLHGPWFLNGLANGRPDDAAMRHRVREEGLAIRAADGITAPSRDVLERTRSHYGMALEHAEVIPNPVPDLSPSDRWEPGSADPNSIVFIGRFDLHKGGDTIIDAFARLVGRVPRARLRFVGPDQGIVDREGRSWSAESYIDSRLPGARESGRVEYLGQQPHAVLAGLRRQAAVTVVCSRYETFGIAATEAMSQGCPLVATGAGALPEIVADGKNGLLCRPDDPGDLAEKLGSVLTDPALALRLGRQAAADCRGRFDPGLLAARSADYYQRVVARSRSPQRAPSTAT